MYFILGFLDTHPIYPNQDLNFYVPLVCQMFLLHNSLGEAYPPNYTVGYDTSCEEDKPHTKGFIQSKGFIQTEDSPESH